MKKATISQAKNHLSALLNLVKRGETVLILDRQRPVARLERVEASGLDDAGRLMALERDGLLQRARRSLAATSLKAAPPAAQNGASIVVALLADREESR